jgi:hypothetical protein
MARSDGILDALENHVDTFVIVGTVGGLIYTGLTFMLWREAVRLRLDQAAQDVIFKVVDTRSVHAECQSRVTVVVRHSPRTVTRTVDVAPTAMLECPVDCRFDVVPSQLRPWDTFVKSGMTIRQTGRTYRKYKFPK